jgi:hypothetical protein
VNAAKTNATLRVEDFPLLWLEGNGGAGYYDTYKGDTFEISGSGNCLYGGSVADYNAVNRLELFPELLTTDFTDTLLSKFKNLTYFRLEDNEITVFVFNENHLLETVIVNANELTAVDASGLAFLETFEGRSNLITTANFENCTNLEVLDLNTNAITNINITNTPSLITVTIRDSSLTGFDISNRSSLTDLDLIGNDLETINILGCSALRDLKLNANNLTSAGISDCVLLESFLVFTNILTDLNISNNSLLTTLRCNNNRLNAAVNSQLLINLDGFGLSNGLFVGTIFGGGSLTTAGAAAKTALQAKGWTVTGL